MTSDAAPTRPIRILYVDVRRALLVFDAVDIPGNRVAIASALVCVAQAAASGPLMIRTYVGTSPMRVN